MHEFELKNRVINKIFGRYGYLCAFSAFIALAAFGQNDPQDNPPSNRPTLSRAASSSDDQDPAWKSKQISDWSEEDAKQVIADSPWVKTFAPTLGSQSRSAGRPAMGMGGIRMGGIGIGMPGMGRGGYPRGGYPGGQSDGGSYDPPQVTLRWESAMPIRAAELKAHDNDAPVIDDKHYAIAVYGVPGRFLPGDEKKLEGELKKEVTLRRDGKKDIKPSDVRIIDKPDGQVVVYEFSTSNEITRDDHRVEFNAKMGRLQLDQSFFLDDMVLQGKREL